jgi:cytochrome c oxidase subunit 1
MATQAAFMPGTKVSAGSVIWSWITTVDHKRIGILYGTSAFFFFLVGGIEALIMRLQLSHLDGKIVL